MWPFTRSSNPNACRSRGHARRLRVHSISACCYLSFRSQQIAIACVPCVRVHSSRTGIVWNCASLPFSASKADVFGWHLATATNRIYYTIHYIRRCNRINVPAPLRRRGQLKHVAISWNIGQLSITLWELTNDRRWPDFVLHMIYCLRLRDCNRGRHCG